LFICFLYLAFPESTNLGEGLRFMVLAGDAIKRGMKRPATGEDVKLSGYEFKPADTNTSTHFTCGASRNRPEIIQF